MDQIPLSAPPARLWWSRSPCTASPSGLLSEPNKFLRQFQNLLILQGLCQLVREQRLCLVPPVWKPSVSTLTSEGLCLWPLSLPDEDKWLSCWPWKPSGTSLSVNQLCMLCFWGCYLTAVCPQAKPAVPAVNVMCFYLYKHVFSGKGRDLKISEIMFKHSFQTLIHSSLIQLTELCLLFPVSSDIDECAEGKHYCRENTMCVNTPGSFMCICHTGYIRIDDYSCTGESFCWPSDGLKSC